MDNEVVIHVTADDDTGRGFSSARQRASMTAVDIEGTFGKSGPKLGDRIGAGIKKGLSSGFLDSVPLAAQFGIGASPLIGAAMSAAVIGGAGIGGVVGGIMLVKDDPRIVSAGTELGKKLTSSLKSDAQVFVEPLTQSIGKIGDAFEGRLRPKIAAIFRDSAEYVAPLTDGLINAVDGVATGIQSAASKAGPVISALSRLAGNVGDAVGSAIDTIAGGSDDAAKFVDDLSDALGGAIRGIGYLVRGLTEAYGWIHDNAEATGLWIHELVAGEEAAGEFARHVATADGALADMTEATQDSTKSLKELSDEMLAQTDPLFALIDGQRDVADAQRDYNKALDKHGPKSAEAKEALDRLGRSAFQLTDKVGDAAGGFNGRLTPAMRTALGNAGLTKSQIDRLERSLKSAAAAANNWEGTYRQTYVTSFKTFGKPYSAEGIARNNIGGLATGGIKGAASGMMGSGRTWVGEHGPELIDLPPGTQVHSNPDSERMAAGSANGGGPIVINLMMSDGQTIARALLPSLQGINRTQYAGDVTRMFPATR